MSNKLLDKSAKGPCGRRTLFGARQCVPAHGNWSTSCWPNWSYGRRHSRTCRMNQDRLTDCPTPIKPLPDARLEPCQLQLGSKLLPVTWPDVVQQAQLSQASRREPHSKTIWATSCCPNSPVDRTELGGNQQDDHLQVLLVRYGLVFAGRRGPAPDHNGRRTDHRRSVV